MTGIALLSAVAGGTALALAWSPLPARLAPGPFSAHMAGHMLLVAVAAPLLAAAAARLAPRRVTAFARHCPPVAAAAVEFVLVWGWHAPALHRAARGGGAALAAEQASFLLAGLALWAGCLARGVDGRLRRGPEGVMALLLTATHMTLLGVLLALSPRPLFTHHASATLPPPWDQELGGIVMLTIGGLAYLAGGLALLAELLQAPRRASQPGGKPCTSA